MAEREGRSTAQAAAEQVRAIVEAAEQSAASVEAAAREEAERIRASADADAAGSREAAARVAERAEELERRLDELADGVRAAVDGLKEELAALRTGAAAPAQESPVPETVAEPAEEAEADVDPTIAETETVAAREPDVGDDTEDAVPAPGEPAAPEGARVLALKMALDGTPRDETARYLRENFKLDDPEALLDEVYAKAGG